MNTLYFPVSSESVSSLGDRLREQVCSVPCLLRTTGVRGGASSRDPHPLEHGVHPLPHARSHGAPLPGVEGGAAGDAPVTILHFSAPRRLAIHTQPV